MTNPILATFADLLAFRTYSAQNLNDGPTNFVKFCAGNFSSSNAQLFQDLLVVFLTQGKRNGFFVEFGASDGINLSNTYFLEKQLQWSGILAEPARCWHESLKRNRSVTVDNRCASDYTEGARIIDALCCGALVWPLRIHFERDLG